MPRMIRTTPTSVTGFTAFSSLSWSCFPDCWCRANRVLPCPESLADLLLRVLQEFISPVQDILAAIEHLPGRLLHGPNALPRRHLIRMSFLTDFPPATPRATCTALSTSAWDLTKPLSCTTPLNVSTLISLTFRLASLKIAVFTFAVITESSTYSPLPSLVAVAPHPQADA